MHGTPQLKWTISFKKFIGLNKGAKPLKNECCLDFYLIIISYYEVFMNQGLTMDCGVMY